MNQKVALIAGVGLGTGAALARAFATEGHAVALLSRQADSSKPVAEQIRAQGGTAVVMPTDVTDPSRRPMIASPGFTQNWVRQPSSSTTPAAMAEALSLNSDLVRLASRGCLLIIGLRPRD